MSLNLTTIELWIEKSKKIMKEKKINISKLKKKFTNIYFPWNGKYDLYRNYYSLRIQQRPLFIIRPISINELEYILHYVYIFKLNIRICTGRHSTQLLSPDVLLDMSLMNKIKSNENTLTIEGGCTQGQCNDYLFNNISKNHYSHFGHFTFGRTNQFPGGSAQTVGSSSISTIGGIGVLRRTFGLTIDSIISFKITTPSNNKNARSKTLKIKQNNNPELFWALCGGGANNFGIISEIKYNIFSVGDIIEYNVSWSWQSAKSVIDLWSITSITRPNTMTEELDIYYTNGVKGISLAGYYVIPENQTVEQAVNIINSNLVNLQGTVTISEPIAYSKLYTNLVKNRKYYNFSLTQGVFCDVIDSDLVVNTINSGSNLNGNISFNLELLGGKILESNIGSFPFRQCKFFNVVSTNWENLIDTQAQEHLLNITCNKMIYSCVGVYLGFPITFTDIPFKNEIYYGKSYKKLLTIKNIYDREQVLSYSGTL